MPKPVYVIDGRNFDSLAGFYDEISRCVVTEWRGRNLDAFNDVLRGGFGTPEGGFVLRWVHSDRSRAVLGHAETAKHLEDRAEKCHPANVPRVLAELEAARRGQGPTLFDILIEIIRDHGVGGREADDAVELELL